MIVITLLFGVFYLVDLQRPMSRYEPYDPRFAGKFKFALFFRNRLVCIIFFLIFQGLVQDLNKSKPCPKKVEEELHPLEKSVPLYIITATYPRLEQLAELTRLGQTLKHVKNMRWIVADDAAVPTKQVMGLLYRLNITYKYILGIKLHYIIIY